MQFQIIDTRSDRGARRSTLRCPMRESHVWKLTVRQLESRLARFGMIKCPFCGAVLESPSKGGGLS